MREIIGLEQSDSRTTKAQFFLTVFLQLIFVGSFIWAFFETLWQVMFVSALGMICIWLPLFFAKKQRVYLPVDFIFVFTLFIYLALFLGEIRSFYFRFWWWDMILHFFSGIALGFIGFLILYSLYKNNRLPISAGLLVFLSFTFAVALGSVWEIFEFAMDSFFGLNMQKSGLLDTMWDLILNTFGALIASTSGYFYLKHQTRGIGIFQYFVNVFLSKNKQI